MEVLCTFTEGASLARLVAVEQEVVERGSKEEVFRWKIKEDDEGVPKGKWVLLGVSGKNER